MAKKLSLSSTAVTPVSLRTVPTRDAMPLLNTCIVKSMALKAISGLLWMHLHVDHWIPGLPNCGVDSCILAILMAFHKLEELPKNFWFIADGYSAYPLAAQQFDITRVIGLTNEVLYQRNSVHTSR